MDSRYLIVDKKILPEYFEKVVEASRLLAEGEAPDISEAVRKVGISRSTYYKYKGDNLYAATTRNWRAGEVNPRDC